MNWYLDVFAEDCMDSNMDALATIQRLQDENRSGPCEDDCELTCQLMEVLPEESDHEGGSPLDFGKVFMVTGGERVVFRTTGRG